MSAIFSRFCVYARNFTAQRAGTSPLHFRQFFLQHRKWCHGLPGIPNDDTVVRLTNTTLGSDLYLVGTCHTSEDSAETVRKVINLVKPDIVAVELCRRRAITLKNWKYENDHLYRIFISSMRNPGGLLMKIGMFLLRLWYRQLRARGTFPGKEFKVAMEESERLKAKLFVIDEDIGVLCLKLSKLSYTGLFRELFRVRDQLEEIQQMYSHTQIKYTRASAREYVDVLRKISPQLVEVLIADRDMLMCRRLRAMRGKVVAVVGLGHMDGIEWWWKLYVAAENSKDAVQPG